MLTVINQDHVVMSLKLKTEMFKVRVALLLFVFGIHSFIFLVKRLIATNPCQNLHKPLTLPETSSGGIGIGYQFAQRRVRQLSDQIRESCDNVGYVNWLVASASYLSFYDEQKKRQEFIEQYFNEIIAKGLDLDGKPIERGVKKTIRKNLTLPIYQSNPDIYSKRSSDGKNFDKYFKWTHYSDKPNNTQGPPPDLNYVQNINPASGLTTCHRKVVDIFKVCEGNIESCKRLDIPEETCKAIHSYPYLPGQNTNGQLTRCDELRNARRDTKQVIGFKLKNNLHDNTNFYSQVFMYVDYHGGIFFPF